MNAFFILLSGISHPTPQPTNEPIPNPTLFPIHPVVCNKLNKINCINSYVCGWCTNSTNCQDDDDDFWNNSTVGNSTDNGKCIEIGYCGIGTKINYSCPFLITNSGCFIIKVCLLAFFLVVSMNLAYCVIRGIHIPLLKSNYSNGCKQLTIITLYSAILIPSIYYYFNNFKIFIYLMTGSALSGILFWIYYGSSKIIRIVNNRNLQSNYNQVTSVNSETDRLLRN